MPEELLGPAPVGWRYASLGELQEAKGIQGGPFGSQLHAEDYVPAGIPLIMPKNIGENRLLETGHDFVSQADAERLAGHRVKTGDIVVGRKGDLSRRALIREAERGWLCGTDCIRIRVDRSIVSPGYLSYYLGLKQVGDWLHRHDTGSTLPSLNTGNLSRLPILVAPRGYQAAIAGILMALDEKIAVNGRIAQTAFDIAEARYVQLCRGATRPRSVGDLLELKYGKALPAAARVEGAFPVYGSGGATGTHDEAMVEGPGIIVGRKGTVGAVYWSEKSFFPIDTTFYVTARHSDTPMEFLFYMLKHLGLASMNSDSAVPGLNRANVLALPVRVPDAAGLRSFLQEARPLFVLRESLSVQSASLARLRDALLPRLMSGEIRVRDAEKVAEDVT
jgi:type I restriction enzyme S subunit